MAKKHPLADLGIQDPAGDEWHGRASAAWAKASSRAERARANGDDAVAVEFYDAPPLPEWEKSEAVAGEVLGRFVYQPGSGLVHDVSRATGACRVDDELPRVFVHFARELEGAVPDDARPHDCMTAG